MVLTVFVFFVLLVVQSKIIIMTKLTYLILAIIAIFFASCTEKIQTLNPDLVKVYLFDDKSNSNVYCFDAKTLPDNEILVFGVNSNSDNQFDTDGKLYLQKINANGETVWHDFYKDFKNGFPSNVIQKSDNEFVLFWSSTSGFTAVTIKVTADKPVIDTKVIATVSPFSTTSIISAATKDNGYLVVGTATDYFSGPAIKKIYLTELNGDFSFSKSLSQQEYKSDAFGTLGTDDLPYIKRFGKFIHLFNINKYWYFVSPYKTKMALKIVGSLEPVYQDSLRWINTFYSDSYNLSLILSHPDNTSEMYYQNGLNVQNIENSFSASTSKTLTGWDTSSPVIIKFLTSQNKTLVAGTSKQGQIKLELYDVAGNKTATHEDLGQAFPYKLTQILELDNGATIAIVGTTMMKNSFKRVFMIKLPASEL